MPSISNSSIIHYPLQAITVDMRDEIPGNNWYHAEVDGRWAGPGLVSTLQLPVLAADLQGAMELGISAENKGGVAAGSPPSLPWLFKGWLVQKAI